MIYEINMMGRKSYALYKDRNYIPIKPGMIIERKNGQYLVKKVTKRGLRLKKIKENKDGE